jgi:peptidoglycan/xylan/chitin deacetylase (PgdA/CDA1 family)
MNDYRDAQESGNSSLSGKAVADRRARRRPSLFTSVLMVTGILIGWWVWTDPSALMTLQGHRMVVLPGLSGPAAPSQLPDDPPTPWSRYTEGDVHRLAVLLTDPRSNWLELVHGLKAKGIPFVLTDQPERALRHRVILVYPILSGKVLSREVIQQLAAHPRQGGTLIACGIIGGGLEEVFGIQEASESRSASSLLFHGEPWLLQGGTPNQYWTIPLRHPAGADPPIGVTRYRPSSAATLASYEDGAAGIVQRPIGSGWAIAVGVDIGYLLWRGHTLRAEGFSGSFNNRFTPATDALLLLLEAVYRRGESYAVTLDPTPDGRTMTVLLTHDVDAQTSMRNALTFAKEEQARGARGTFFIQTKYIRDFNDEVFLTDQWITDMKALAAMGMEIGSHTVAHSKVFDQFPIGTGTEQYPDYRPIVTGRLSARGATVLGELRVSKFLLETLAPGVTVQSFRAGELAYPLGLPQALVATGYHFNSTATANTALTHLPYRLMKDRMDLVEVDQYEFPVAVEDEELPPLGDRLPDALKLAEQMSRYGGVLTVLIHPNILDHKLRFEVGLIEALKATAWIGALDEFGAWWRGRDHVEVDIIETHQGTHLRLTTREAVSGLTILLPPSCVVQEPDKGLQTRRAPRPWASTAVVVSLAADSEQVIPLDGCRQGGPRT